MAQVSSRRALKGRKLEECQKSAASGWFEKPLVTQYLVFVQFVCSLFSLCLHVFSARFLHNRDFSWQTDMQCELWFQICTERNWRKRCYKMRSWKKICNSFTPERVLFNKKNNVQQKGQRKSQASCGENKEESDHAAMLHEEPHWKP